MPQAKNFLYLTFIKLTTALSISDLQPQNDFRNNFNSQPNFQQNPSFNANAWPSDGSHWQGGQGNQAEYEYENQFGNIRPGSEGSFGQPQIHHQDMNGPLTGLSRNRPGSSGYSGTRPGNIKFCVKKCSLQGLKCDFKTLGCRQTITRTVQPVTCPKNMIKINNNCYCQPGCTNIGHMCLCCQLKPNTMVQQDKCVCKIGYTACSGFDPFDRSQIGCVKINACQFMPCPPPSVCYLKSEKSFSASSSFDSFSSIENSIYQGSFTDGSDPFYTCPGSGLSQDDSNFGTLDKIDPNRGHDFGKYICECPFTHKWDRRTEYCVEIEKTQTLPIPIDPKTPTVIIPPTRTDLDCNKFSLFNQQTKKCDCLWRMHGHDCKCKSYEWFDKRYNLCRKMNKEAERLCKLHVKCVHLKYSYCQALGPNNIKCVCDSGYFYDELSMKCLRNVRGTTDLVLNTVVPDLARF